jgi:hypothetical protein
MSLEGTLETVALPDVLGLLSVTAKTGELRVASAGLVGSIWLEGGRVSGYDVAGQNGPVDALFALLRLSEGTFKFHTGTEVRNPLPANDVAPLLSEAEAQLAEWPSISAAVPSLSAEVKLVPSLEAPVMVQPEQWLLLSAIGSGSTVAEVLAGRGLSEFEGCKALAELARFGLVEVAGGGAAAAAGTSGRAAPAPGLGREVPFGPGPEAWQQPGVPTSIVAGPDGNGRGGLLVKPVKLREDDEVVPPEAAGVAAKAPDLSEARAEANPEAEAEPKASGEEAKPPVNRGLLLKFLGSARN